MKQTNKMLNEKKLIIQEAYRVLIETTPSLLLTDFNSIKKQSYTSLGIDYWNWMDFLANLESIFSKDLSETTDKFKIQTIDEVIKALYCAPNISNLYNN